MVVALLIQRLVLIEVEETEIRRTHSRKEKSLQ